MQYVVLKDTVIQGRLMQTGEPVDITDSAYADELLRDGNIGKPGEPAPRVPVEETPADQEAPAETTPLETSSPNSSEGNDQPTPQQVAEAVQSLEGGRENSQEGSVTTS